MHNIISHKSLNMLEKKIFQKFFNLLFLSKFVKKNFKIVQNMVQSLFIEADLLIKINIKK